MLTVSTHGQLWQSTLAAAAHVKRHSRAIRRARDNGKDHYYYSAGWYRAHWFGGQIIVHEVDKPCLK